MKTVNLGFLLLIIILFIGSVSATLLAPPSFRLFIGVLSAILSCMTLLIALTSKPNFGVYSMFGIWVIAILAPIPLSYAGAFKAGIITCPSTE